MGFSTFVCKFVRDGLPKFCCCVAFWCKFSKTFSQRLPADRWTKSVDQIMGPLDLDDIFWLLRIDDFVDGWCPKPESISLGPSTFTRNTVKDWRWLEYPKRVERNKDAKWCFFWKPKPHQDFLDCEDCQKSRDGSSLSLRKSEHILATKLGIIRILFYLHLTFFFWTPIKSAWFPTNISPSYLARSVSSSRKLQHGRDLKRCATASLDKLRVTEKLSFFLRFFLGRGTNHILDWHVAWLQFFPFLTYGKSPCGWYSHYLPCFCQVFGWHQILSISLLVAEVWLCIVSGIKPNQRWQWTFIESPAWFW